VSSIPTLSMLVFLCIVYIVPSLVGRDPAMDQLSCSVNPTLLSMVSKEDFELEQSKELDT
jgi:hypothetical protein